MPQIFLRSVILAKSWDHWTAWDMSEEFWSHREYCSDQTIFFFSLCLNFIQIAVTLQDLMERDVPYGVFPHALSSAMRQSSRLQSCKWQLAMFVYYVANILGRCLAWVPFAIFFGFKGFLYVFLFAILLRYILVAAVLAQYKCSDQENFEESLSCSCSQANAIFAETLPWTMLAVFVDLPLNMAGLRSDSKKKIQLQNSGSRYRYSRSFFLLSHILSAVENVVLFVMVHLMTVEHGVTCGIVDVVRSKKLYEIEKACRPESTVHGNYTYFECAIESGDQIPEGFWKAFKSYYTVYAIAFFTMTITGGVLQCALYRMLKFQGLVFARETRTSIEMKTYQHAGRSFKNASARMSIAEASAIVQEAVTLEKGKRRMKSCNSWRDGDMGSL